MPLYLGLDASTQHVTLQAIDVDSDAPRLVFEHTTNFDRDLPAYGTRYGILPSADPRVAVAPPLMWAEALDRAMAAFARSGLEVSRVAAVSGSAQQHGSVYLNATASATLASLNPAQPLVEQIGGIFARPTSPVWLDTSTSDECREITEAMGGAAELARLTGSRAFERFTGPQIRRFAKTLPAGYEQTARIHLVSSFLASLLAGRARAARSGRRVGHESDGPGAPRLGAGRDRGDGARSRREAPADRTVMDRGGRRCRRTGANATRLPAASVVVWSGDNPCSLIGTGLVDEGRIGDLAGHERHGLRPDARAADRPDAAPATCSARRPAISWD